MSVSRATVEDDFADLQKDMALWCYSPVLLFVQSLALGDSGSDLLSALLVIALPSVVVFNPVSFLVVFVIMCFRT